MVDGYGGITLLDAEYPHTALRIQVAPKNLISFTIQDNGHNTSSIVLHTPELRKLHKSIGHFLGIHD